MPKRLGCHAQPWQPVGVLLIAVVTEWVTNNGSLFTWQTTKSGSLCVCAEVNNKHSHFLLDISALISLPLCCFLSRPFIFIRSSTKGLGDTLFKLKWPWDPPITRLGMSTNWWHGSHRRFRLDDGGVAIMTELNLTTSTTRLLLRYLLLLTTTTIKTSNSTTPTCTKSWIDCYYYYYCYYGLLNKPPH